MAHCQVVELMLRDWLPCKHRESGGRQCEREEAHGDDTPHWFSMHTMLHDRAGNGWACSSFKEPVAVHAYRERLREQVLLLTDELEELDLIPPVP
ncbi:hypothetical protein SEA_ATUIN_267 [Arthrobacter phage Atuin]|nr:hypothetical protein SEA_ATUIN_66 [Arthrobacter phage Atuin]